MACRGFWEGLLKLLNFILGIVGLAIVGYGVYLLIEYQSQRPGGGGGDGGHSIPPVPPPVRPDPPILELGRPMLMLVTFSESFVHELPKAWFIYAFTGLGGIIFIVSFFGCIGSMTRNGCCLSCYSFLVFLLIILELAAAAFIFFDKSWMDEIPYDRTGNFDKIYDFLDDNWEIVRWIVLGVIIFEVLLFLLALIVRAANRPADYDSDDDYIAPRSNARQPLLNRQGAQAAPPTGSLDQRPSRNDAWSQRMREKYGLDTSEFTYNPSDPNRYQQGQAPPVEESSRCTIL